MQGLGAGIKYFADSAKIILAFLRRIGEYRDMKNEITSDQVKNGAYKVVLSEAIGTPSANYPMAEFETLSAARKYAEEHAEEYHYGLAVIDENGNDVSDCEEISREMAIEYSDGRVIWVSDVEEAKTIINEEYPEAVYGDEQRGKILVWEDEEHAENDPGQKAVAVILI
jgi:hypothetical protein